MTAKGKWRRWVGRAAGAGAVLLAGAAATLDFWGPRAGAAWVDGLSHGSSETRAGRTVAWTDVAWEGEGVKVKVARAEVSAPWRVIWRGRVDATITGWRVDAGRGAGETEKVGGASFGWPELWAELGEVAGLLEKRAGEIELTDGVIVAGGESVAVSRLGLRGGRAEGALSWRGEAVEFAFKAGEAEGWVRVAARELKLEVRGEADAVNGTVEWAGNRAKLAASGFVAGGWVPAEASLRGEDWRVPVARLGAAEGFYGELRGGFLVKRAGAGVAVEVDAKAEPVRAGLPPLVVGLAGEGSAERVRLARLRVEAPAAVASLSAPVEWSAAGGWESAAAEFKVEGDLGVLSAGAVKGRLDGVARVEDGRVRWEAGVKDGAWRELAGIVAKVRGATSDGVTTVEEARVELAGGTRVEAGGRVRHADGFVEDGKVKGEVEAGRLRAWLPEGLEAGRVEFEGTARGGWREAELAGAATVADARYAGWAAEEIRVEGKGAAGGGWAGTAAARRGAERLYVAGGYEGGEARLETVRWTRADGAELGLEGAGEIGAERARVRLAGEGGRVVAADWARGRELELEVREWDTGWLAGWRDGEPLPEARVRVLTARGTRDGEGYVAGEAEVEAAGRIANGAEIWVRAAVRADAGGVSIIKLDTGKGARTLASGAGLAPWRWRPGGAPEWTPVAGGEWSLRLATRPEAEVWETLAAALGAELERPELVLGLEGPAEAPAGRVRLAAGRVGLRGDGLPEGGVQLRELKAEATLRRDEVVVSTLEAEADGQRMRAEGRLVLADGDWARLRERPYVWLRDHAEARLHLPEAQVAALARYLPTLLAPMGTVEAELALSPGARLDGRVVLRDGATRPLGDFGVLHDIDVELALAGMDIRVERATARAAGQTVSVTGGARRDPGKLPALDLALKAERFPLVRSPGLVVRGDLDLAVKTGAGGTRLSGTVALRDSLALADIRPLLASGGGGGAGAPAARARPPYFSVDTPPLGGWGLDVAVTGDRFVRVKTPVFAGRASARLALGGTLGEPRVAGELTVDEGTILFPFASLAVQEGAVRVARNDPYTVRLDFRAAGRRLGYDLRLELDGTADAPQMRLFSTPSLDAEALLLMVTAGVAPSQEHTARGVQRLAAVGAYMGRDLLRTFGLGGAEEERLSIRAGEQVSRAGRETYGFEYRLGGPWSLVGDYDEFDAYNVGLRRLFRAKEPEVERATEPAIIEEEIE